MQMIALTPKTVHFHNIDLLISVPDGQAFLCFQFQTGDGMTPTFSIPIKDTSFETLHKIQNLVDALTFATQQPTLATFIDVPPATTSPAVTWTPEANRSSAAHG